MNTRLLLLLNLWAILWLPAQAQPDSPIDTDLLAATLGEFFKAKNPHPDAWWVNAETASVRYEPGFGLVVFTPVFRAQPAALTSVRSGDRVTIESKPNTKTPGTNPDLVTGLLTDWLLAYGVQARDLPAEEKVLVTYKTTGNAFGTNPEPLTYSYNIQIERNNQSVVSTLSPDPVDSLRVRELTLEVPVSALRDFKLGKIKEPEFRKQVRQVSVRTLKDKAPEAPMEEKVFINMLRSLSAGYYRGESASENTYFYFNNGLQNGLPLVSGTHTPGLGYEFQIGANHPAIDVNGRQSTTLRWTGRRWENMGHSEWPEAASPAEREAEREAPSADWGEFQTRLANAILDYGPTLRLLAAGERLSVRIRKPDEVGDEWPEHMTASISYRDLMQWDQRAISRDEAFEAISWTE